jgi:hypothetical protein
LKDGKVLSALFICTFLRIYKFRSLQERPSKPVHKRKDGVEVVEKSGLVNKHIFWRSSRLRKYIGRSGI